MTLPALIDALWQARAVVTLNAAKQPVLRGAVGPELLAALTEHREEIVHLLRGIKGARLEGLVCATCDRTVAEGRGPDECGPLRWCEACRWATQHFPRIA